jgi:hypothetical protein
VQVVGYATTPSPALLLASDGRVHHVPVGRGAEAGLALGRRRCAGDVTDGSHHACGESTAPYCPAHERPRWVPEESDEEHAVYLAAFAPDTFKVGITRSWRLERRLREQGADRAALVATTPDGESARSVETALDADHDGTDGPELGQQVRVADKVAGFGRSVDERRWERLLTDLTIRRRFDLDYGFSLSGAAVPETLLSGRIRGVKGRVLVLDHAGTTYAVDMRDLLGHHVAPGEEKRRLQSGLGAW